MAALAFLGAMTVGCSGDDLAAETPQLPNTTNGTVVTKVTVSLDEHASTRMLDPSGLKTFEEGDKIAVIYTNTAGVTVKAESDPLQATDLHDAKKTGSFSVTLTNPQANTPVRYIYPAAMAADDVSATTPDNDATIKWSNLASQYGSFAFISEHVDLAVFDGTMTAQSNLPEPAPLKNQLTVGAFTIENSGGTDVTNTITKLTISDGTNTYNVSPSTLSTINVAMKPISNTQTVVVQATDGTAHYVKTVTGKTLAKNNITPVNVKMFTGTPASSALPANLGDFLGADGFIYADATAAAATGTTAVAMIAYVGSETGSATYNHGLAIALTDATTSNCAWAVTTESAGVSSSETMTDHKNFLNGIGDTETLVTKYGSGCAAYIAKNYGVDVSGFTNSGWFLPSSGQWLKFFGAAGVDVANWTSWGWAPAPDGGTKVDNWTKINTLLTAAGGPVQQYWYWSSTEYTSNTAVSVRFSAAVDEGVRMFFGTKDSWTGGYVRSFLAF